MIMIQCDSLYASADAHSLIRVQAEPWKPAANTVIVRKWNLSDLLKKWPPKFGEKSLITTGPTYNYARAFNYARALPWLVKR